MHVLMDAPSGIVDGARKISQSGSWILVGALERNLGFSLVLMLEATLSRDQCMSALPVLLYLYSCTAVRGWVGTHGENFPEIL